MNHLAIPVTDQAGSRAFYEPVAPPAWMHFGVSLVEAFWEPVD